MSQLGSQQNNPKERILLMNPDGSGEVKLTNNSWNDANPVWSPDGTKILFSSDRTGNLQIYSMNLDGSGLSQLTSSLGSWSDYPDWQPTTYSEVAQSTPTAISQVNSAPSPITENVFPQVVININVGLFEFSFIGIGVLSIASITILELYLRKRRKND